MGEMVYHSRAVGASRLNSRMMWFARTKEVAALGARVVAGTAVYVVIVVLATPLPAAAGLMLTFPALNGLAFVFSEDVRAASIARSMLWMPVINGVLCAGYISSFAFVAKAGASTFVAWGLVGIIVAVWLVCVSRARVRKGIAPEHQLAFVAAVTVVGMVLAAAGGFESTHVPVAEAQAPPVSGTDGAGWITAPIWGSKLKIGLFALALVAFFSSIAYLPISDSTRGILAGLPLVPFGGLVAIAGDVGMSLDARLEIFRGMMSSAWLGPAVASWFIFFFSRFLSMRVPLRTAMADSVLRFGALLAAWGATFGAIVVLAYAIRDLLA